MELDDFESVAPQPLTRTAVTINHRLKIYPIILQLLLANAMGPMVTALARTMDVLVKTSRQAVRYESRAARKQVAMVPLSVGCAAIKASVKAAAT